MVVNVAAASVQDTSAVDSQRVFGRIAVTVNIGTDVAGQYGMSPNTTRERGAQEEKTGEREAKHSPSTRQDFTRPKEGRDVAPEDEKAKGTRTTDSPWMGGG